MKVLLVHSHENPISYCSAVSQTERKDLIDQYIQKLKLL